MKTQTQNQNLNLILFVLLPLFTAACGKQKDSNINPELNPYGETTSTTVFEPNGKQTTRNYRAVAICEGRDDNDVALGVVIHEQLDDVNSGLVAISSYSSEGASGTHKQLQHLMNIGLGRDGDELIVTFRGDSTMTTSGPISLKQEDANGAFLKVNLTSGASEMNANSWKGSRSLSCKRFDSKRVQSLTFIY